MKYTRITALAAIGVAATLSLNRDLVVVLEAAGTADPETVLDDPLWVEWRGGRAHEWTEVCKPSQMRQQCSKT
ncbi:MULTISPECIES: hypothetical protein [unclassified Streptomyces]|uniref:hypothetical protein n=1 Tax=unclassified Streptomyces TaxID=2593676 RepID=UPI00093D22E4|nr:hypothetical protein [Streptomyces sp. CB01580]